MAKITAKSAEQEAAERLSRLGMTTGASGHKVAVPPAAPVSAATTATGNPISGQEGKGSAPVHHCLSRAGSQGEALCPGERHHGERPAAWVHRLTVRTVLSRSTEPQMIPGKAVLRRRLFLCAQRDDDYDESAGRRNRFQEPTGVRSVARELY